jgi:hypothetical protein
MGLEKICEDGNLLHINTIYSTLYRHTYFLTPEIIEQLNRDIRNGIITNTTELVSKLDTLTGSVISGQSGEEYTYDQCNSQLDLIIQNIPKEQIRFFR